VLDFVVCTFLGPLRRLRQGSRYRDLIDQFNNAVCRQHISVKVLSVEGCQSIGISDKPRLHRLDHQKTLFISCTCRLPPTILMVEMLPGRLRHWRFRIDQKDIQCIRMGTQRELEIIKRLLASAADDDTKLDALTSGAIDQCLEKG